MLECPRIVRCAVGGAMVLHVLAGTAAAQTCGGRWLEAPGARGPAGLPATAGLWDSDGAGPKPAGPVVFGADKVGAQVSPKTGSYFDGAAWRVAPMRPWDVFSRLDGVAGLRDGALLAWGLANGSSGPNDRLFRWSGGAWTELATSPFAFSIDEVIELPSGEPVICGLALNQTQSVGLLRWDGAGWRTLGAGVRGRVRSVAAAANGDLIAGGAFTDAGGVFAENIARWDGSAWSAMGGGLPAGEVQFVRSAGADLIAVTWSSPSLRFFRWDGAAWSEATPALSRLASDVQLLADGSIVVGWSGPGDAPDDRVIARWDGSAWTTMAGGVRVQQVVTASSSDSYRKPQIQRLLKLEDGGLAAIGVFDLAGATGVDNAARWDGISWGGLGDGPDGMVVSMLELPTGEIVVGGSFRSIAGVPIERVAMWDGGSWRAVGDGFGIAPDSCTEVCSLALDEQGRLLAATSDVNPLNFLSYTTLPQGTRALRIWRLEGESWVQIGGDLQSRSGRLRPVIGHALDWSLLVGRSWINPQSSGAAGLLVWNGGTWLRDPGFVAATSFLPDGNQILIGGDNSGSQVWISGLLGYSNGVLKALPLTTSASVSALGRRANGNVLSSGFQSGRTTIAEWNGFSWTTLGSQLRGVIPSSTAVPALGTCFAETPAGEPLVGGYFDFAATSPTTACDGLAVYRDGNWRAFDATFVGPVFGMLRTSGGELLVAGGRSAVDGRINGQFSRWTDDGKPWVVKRPSPTRGLIGSEVRLGARLASGYGVVEYRWERQTDAGWTPVVDGAGGAGAGGGIVSGSSGLVDTDAANEVMELRIAGSAGADAGVYRVRVFNACGQSVTPGARLAVGCNAADMNGDGALDLADFMAFLGCWDESLACADVDADGRVTSEDFFAFFAGFDAGC